jgi:hypothetical protein
MQEAQPPLSLSRRQSWGYAALLSSASFSSHVVFHEMLPYDAEISPIGFQLETRDINNKFARPEPKPSFDPSL